MKVISTNEQCCYFTLYRQMYSLIMLVRVVPGLFYLLFLGNPNVVSND